MSIHCIIASLASPLASSLIESSRSTGSLKMVEGMLFQSSLSTSLGLFTPVLKPCMMHKIYESLIQAKYLCY